MIFSAVNNHRQLAPHHPRHPHHGIQRAAAALLCAAAALLLLSCSSAKGNFSQRHGFDAIRAELGSTAPNAAEQTLLRQYQPVLYIAAGEEGPIDFYRDYIGSGTLYDGNGKLVAHNPSAAVLNQHRHDPGAVFTHQPPPAATLTAPAAYGGILRATLTVGGEPRRLTFLTYHFVFRKSGLPAGLHPVLRRLADVVADSRDWHQLDHYTAAFIALDGERPFAVLLQQHNYMRTYLIGADAAFPAGGGIAIDAAISSNELYPHRARRTQRPAVGFIKSDNIEYLVGMEEDGGFFDASDITDGSRRVTYTLSFLPPDDAFYVFEGYLGERRLLPGREGPPGAIYRHLPELWSPATALAIFYWKEKDEEYVRIIQADGLGETAGREKLQTRFYADWLDMEQRPACPDAENNQQNLC